MRRLLCILALAAALLPSVASAQAAWTLDKFRADVAVGTDGMVEVKETVDADFTTPRHGIYRYVPYRGTNDQGGKYLLDVTLVSVTRDGRGEPYQETRDGKDVQWKIGSADRTLDGAHEYVITYDVRGALGAFASYDEIYWNATGDGWDVPLPAGAAALVRLPPGVNVLQSACYTGPEGSTATDCQIVSADGQVGFATRSAGEPLTVAVGFPKGSVPILAATGAGATVPSPLTLLLLLLPVGTLVGLLLLWGRKGRDARFAAIVAQYEPPDGLRPAEVTALLAQGFGNRADVPSTIIDLAVRGYVKIEEISGFLGSKDYVLTLQKAYTDDASLKAFERAMLDGLFMGGSAGATVKVSSLRYGGFRAAAMRAGQELSKGLIAGGYVDPAAAKISTGVMVAGIAAMFLGFFAPLVGPAVFVSGVVASFFGRIMAKWTDKGHDAAWHAKGYKEFISKVEKYRAPWMETQAVFEQVLPYALAFGLGKKWAKAFENVTLAPPSWYVGAQAGAWNAAAFSSRMQGFSSTFATRSGTSGSGGGGSSGGGGGGGGGGSW